MIKIEYSVDMVRLKTKVPHEHFMRFSNKYLDYDPNVEYRTLMQINAYRHNWNIKQQTPFGQEFSYWIGYQHNSEKPSVSSGLVIQYNPNKCPLMGVLANVLRVYFSSEEVEVISVDLAMDFALPIDKLIVDRQRKQNMQIHYYSSEMPTYYIGKGDGRIKIYDKAKELGIDGVLTRYEVSKEIREKIKDIQSPEFDFKANIIPVGYLTPKDTDKSLDLVLWAVQNGYPIGSLTRRNKEKVREYLDEKSELQFSEKDIRLAIQQYFQAYRDILQF